MKRASGGEREGVAKMDKEANHSEVPEESKRFDELEEMLKDGAEELQALKSCFFNEEQETDDELEAIKGIMIEELIDVTREESIIGIKEMGKLDEEEDVVDDEKLIALKEEWGIEAYNTIVRCMVLQEDVVDDEKLIALKEEWWVEAYNAVVRALLEMNKYNPSARLPVHQMWNFRDDREASVSEAIGLVMKDMKT